MIESQCYKYIVNNPLSFTMPNIQNLNLAVIGHYIEVYKFIIHS